MRILIVEDDEHVASLIKRALAAEHYVVDVARDGISGYELAVVSDYDVIILDVMLPGLNGREVCRALRRESIHTPVLMLTALGTSSDIVSGLDDGADDYLVKPFEITVLLARVRSLARRHSEQRTALIEIADLTIDLTRRTAVRASRTLRLSAKEFALLEYLAINRGRVLSRSDIAERVWDGTFDASSNVVESLIRFVRRKVDRDFETPLIHTVRNTGYYIDDSPH
jgi:DNA-binding response OmpR family regulator